MRAFLSKLLFGSEPQTTAWTAEQWRDHLLAKTVVPSERSEIEAIFGRSL